MTEYKVVPFAAHIKREDTTTTVAQQMQRIIDSHAKEGWQYLQTDSVQTSVAATKGCFGIGAEPGYITSYNVLVFTR